MTRPAGRGPPASDPAAPPQASHGYLEGVRGLRLHYRTWEVASPRAGIVVVHGLAEHCGRYAGFAEAMAEHGYSTFAADLRGHGGSEGRRGHARRFAVLLQDLERFRREVQGLLEPGSPLFLLGHSFGGLIVLRYLEEYESPFRGGVVVSPWLATRADVPRWKLLASRLLDRVAPAVPIRAGINAAHLSRDPDVGRAYRDDPLVHDTVTPRLFVETSNAMGDAFQRSDRLRVPLLFLIAGDDHLVDSRRALSLVESLPPERTTLRVFPDAFHEILNEPERRRAYDAIDVWIRGRLG